MIEIKILKSNSKQRSTQQSITLCNNKSSLLGQLLKFMCSSSNTRTGNFIFDWLDFICAFHDFRSRQTFNLLGELTYNSILMSLRMRRYSRINVHSLFFIQTLCDSRHYHVESINESAVKIPQSVLCTAADPINPIKILFQKQSRAGRLKCCFHA